MNWIYVIMDVFYKTRRSYLELVIFLGLKLKLENEIPNNGCNMADMDIEGRKLMQEKYILKSFSYKIAYLIYPENPTFS